MAAVWLITGSSRGLGRALAEVVLAAGNRLVATARDVQQLQHLVSRFGDLVRPVALDVTDPQAVSEAVDAAVSAFGRLDVLVNNAGYGKLGPVEDTSLEEFREQIETNLFGVINVTKAAIPVMRAQRAGHIIQISSIAARSGPPGRAPYATAKWAVEGFSEVLAKEVAPIGIKVTVVEPGGFRTDFAQQSLGVEKVRPEYDATVGQMARFQHDYDGKQPGDPAKAAQAILHITTLEQPPLRLLLGRDAVKAAETVEQARIESDRKWRELSVSTDFT
jgi:NAD(P)-dependent dehydrogenase (short-subunit alcohol dehydrogenase family)